MMKQCITKLIYCLPLIFVAHGATAARPTQPQPGHYQPSAPHNDSSSVSIPSSTGGFMIGGSYFSFQPRLTDSDLQYGTQLQLIVNPPTLSTHVVQILPGYRSGYQGTLGYQFAGKGGDIQLSYFGFNHHFNAGAAAQTLAQFIQTYLGSSWSSAIANTSLSVNDVKLAYGQTMSIDNQLFLHFALGANYAYIRRDFNTRFDQQLPPIPGVSYLQSEQTSKFNGVGPMLAIHFLYPLMHGFSLAGNLGSSLLIGTLKSDINAKLVQNLTQTNYAANQNDNGQLVPTIDTSLALQYAHRLGSSHYALIAQLGYAVRDYIKSLNRINPVNGFTRNPNPPQLNLNSSVGFNGPFLKLMVKPQLLDEYASPNPSAPVVASGLNLAITNLILKPLASNNDLNYAIVNNPNGSTQAIHTSPGYHWAGDVALGYVFNNSNTDVGASYGYFSESFSDAYTATGGQTISSLNANGPSQVVYGRTGSNVKYQINHADLHVGHYFLFGQHFLFHPFIGLGFADIVRKQDNYYLDGTPDTVSLRKYPHLKSQFWGIGPEIGTDMQWRFNQYVGIASHLSIAMLIGQMKAELQESEYGVSGVASYTSVRTGGLHFLVPTGTAKAGIFFHVPVASQTSVNLELGYQATGYFKGVDLLYPVFLTGLEQTNTSLGLIGPYASISIRGI